MIRNVSRRDFLAGSLGLVAGGVLLADEKKEPWFKLSLAQWSYHRAFFKKSLDPKNFAAIAKKDHGIEAVEYVNQFYKDKVKDKTYLADLKKIADDNGVRSVLIMCDGEGALGDPDAKKRMQAVENHYKWVEWAKFLGCHSIRVNAQTGNKGTPEEQLERVADGYGKLVEFGAKHNIGVIIENHGGLSSNGEWLAKVMKTVNNKNCGTLPDFGNFGAYDRYKGVTELMPFAKGVSAKSHEFNDKGDEVKTDYKRMMKIVKDAGYRSFVGVEYEGSKHTEPEGVELTKKLLLRVRDELA